MSVVVVVTAYPIPKHRAEVVAAFEEAIAQVHANRALSCSRCMRGLTGWS
jgi:quinol monooxygenase YgiN